MFKLKVRIAIAGLMVLMCLEPAQAQITASDMRFARVFAYSRRMSYEQGGGDMIRIKPLLAEAEKSGQTDPVKAYRASTQALVLMSGTQWTEETELTTALDFSIHAKVLAPGEYLETRATFLFDAPQAATPPYRMELDIIKGDGTKEASVEPGIVLGDVRSRRAGETIGFIFDASKLVSPGLHAVRATLKDGQGTVLYQYYRTFFLIRDLDTRLAVLEKLVGLLPDDGTPAAATARYLLETIKRAHLTYLGGIYQNLVGFVHSYGRTAGLSLTGPADFDAELERATKLANALREERNPFDQGGGDIRLAYRSSFDGKLVPYRVYVPSTYDKSKRYPLIMMLHGLGGDENSFFTQYENLWTKLAEERGYIAVAANGRDPMAFYSRESGSEQDVMDVVALIEKNYSVDPARVYLTGHSMGAVGTWSIGLKYSDRFAALAPIAGTMRTPALEATLSSGRKVPIIIVAGAKDALVPVAGCREVSERAKALGYEVKYLEYPDGDHKSVAVTSIKDIFDWFDGHRRSTP